MIVKSPIQKILFGSPGTGKSYKVHHTIIKDELKIIDTQNIVSTVFHPEYTYGDFMGKLVPLTKGNTVRYHFYEGHFLRAITQAYINIIAKYNDPTKEKDFKDLSDTDKLARLEQSRKLACKNASNVALVIDEINRGNSSAIFGIVFQLLDRENDGWSSYKINLTEIELLTIIRLIGVEEKPLADNKFEYQFPGENHWVQDYSIFQNRVNCLQMNLKDRSIKIPPNLSIIGTMNTSDNSIYFMDSAFKRRWDWEFIDWDNSKPPSARYGQAGILNDDEWKRLIQNLNSFIKGHRIYPTLKKKASSDGKNCFVSNLIHNLELSFIQIEIMMISIIEIKDFTSKDIKYFYEFLFHDLGERETDGKLKVNIKWGITFDEECAPIQVAKRHVHPKSKKVQLEYLDSRIGRPRLPYRSHVPELQYLPYRRYGTIDINGTPIFYYIYFTLQEILDAIKQIPT